MGGGRNDSGTGSEGCIAVVVVAVVVVVVGSVGGDGVRDVTGEDEREAPMVGGALDIGAVASRAAEEIDDRDTALVVLVDGAGCGTRVAVDASVVPPVRCISASAASIVASKATEARVDEKTGT